MGVWEKVESAGFPIKTGAMYRWGSSDDLWRFDFLVGEKYIETPRPSPLRGQRWRTTFHVDRAIYDKILLDHAQELGAEVRQGVKVTGVRKEGDRITGLELGDGSVVTAKHYVDASGHVGFLRRNMGVAVNEPTKLKNIAIWDYFQNPAWAETVNKGAIRARIFSVGYGWLWYLPLGTTRTSIGFVTHAEYYKSTKMKPEELFHQALKDEPFISGLMAGATSEGKLSSTKDWSFIADRLHGENWYLVGESAGFADPILAAGMTLAHVGARELAYALLAMMKGTHEEAWLKEWYETINKKRIGQHIRFADFWYSSNKHFDQLKEYTAEIAAEAGLEVSPDEGFRWLAAGGFVSDSLAAPAVGSYQIGSAKILMQKLTGETASWHLNKFNEFRLDLVGAEKVEVPLCVDGEIVKTLCYRKGMKILPLAGIYRLVVNALNYHHEAKQITGFIRNAMGATANQYHGGMPLAIDALEGMIAEGWVKGKLDKKKPMIRVEVEASSMHVSEEQEPEAIAAYS
jgi:flavin-dependent dehydrogenase